MAISFKSVDYQKLNSRQQETYNFQKLLAVLADFGYLTIRLSDDWNGADLIAQNFKTKAFLKVQLKGRLTFDKKYIGQDLYICFKDDDHGSWYMYEHDELLKKVDAEGKITRTKTMKAKKPYHYPTLSKEIRGLLEPYRIPDVATIRA